MPTFAYQARSSNGSLAKGTRQATTRKEILDWIASEKMIPLQLTETREKRALFSGVSGKQKAAMYALLADLLESGVPLVKSLKILIEQTSNQSLRKILDDLTNRVVDGSTLAGAMQDHQNLFGDLAISMIRAGEEGGFLEDSLKRIAIFTEKQDAMKGKILSALAYPMFLLVIGVVVVAGMILFFVPRFAPLFERMQSRGELPTATVMLLSVSDFARAYYIWMVTALGLLFFVLLQYLKTEKGQTLIDSVKLKLGLLGTIYRNLAIARFCRALGTLLKSGVPMLHSLDIAREATVNRTLSRAIAQVSENVQSGKSLIGPLSASKQFPSEILEMIHVGEQTNRLETLLIDIADKLEVRTQRKLDVLVKLIEPSLMLVMAIVIGFLVIALLLPVFESSGSLG